MTHTHRTSSAIAKMKQSGAKFREGPAEGELYPKLEVQFRSREEQEAINRRSPHIHRAQGHDYDPYK